MRKSIQWLVVILVVMVLSGCGAMRYSSTLKPSGDKELSFGQARFSLVDFNTIYAKNNPGAETWMKGIDRGMITARAKTLYHGQGRCCV